MLAAHPTGALFIYFCIEGNKVSRNSSNLAKAMGSSCGGLFKNLFGRHYIEDMKLIGYARSLLYDSEDNLRSAKVYQTLDALRQNSGSDLSIVFLGTASREMGGSPLTNYRVYGDETGNRFYTPIDIGDKLRIYGFVIANDIMPTLRKAAKFSLEAMEDQIAKHGHNAVAWYLEKYGDKLTGYQKRRIERLLHRT
mgnify:CR=1 FL=1